MFKAFWRTSALLAVFPVWILTLVFGSPAALGYASPDLNLQRTRLVQWIPYSQVMEVQQWVPELSVVLSPSEFYALLQQRFPERRSLAWVFYGCWLYLDRMDQVSQGYRDRLEALGVGDRLLRDYELRCNRALRVLSQPEAERELQLTDPESRPSNEVGDHDLTVLRPLPWPESGWTRSQVMELKEACHQDRQRLHQQRAQIDQARQRYDRHLDIWLSWMLEVTQATRHCSQSEALEAFSPSLPQPPESKESFESGLKSDS